MTDWVKLSTRGSVVYVPTGATRAARYRSLERKARGSPLLGGAALPYDAPIWPLTVALPDGEEQRSLRTSGTSGSRRRPVIPTRGRCGRS